MNVGRKREKKERRRMERGARREVRVERSKEMRQ